MPFPADNTPWPLDGKRYDRIAERSVWYAGDPTDLEAFYRGDAGGTAKIARWEGGGISGGLFKKDRQPVVEAATSKFWGTIVPGEEKVHLPVPEKISHMSAEALFSDPPRFVVEGPTVKDPTTGKVTPAANTAATQARLDALVEQTGLLATLLSAAETASALGSVALRIGWDKDVAPHPTISRADADTYDPFYSWGVQTGTLFWRVLEQNPSQTWRHLELHEGGAIYHALYVGTEVNLGRAVPLTERRETARYAEAVNEFGAVFARNGVTTAVSIPNMLPDPLDRRSNVGRSDYTPATLGLFSAIDRAVTSLMRDVEDGESKLLVADYMLKNLGFGKGAAMPADRTFVALKRNPGDQGQEAPIDQVQFDIRVEEHLAIIADLTKRAIEAAGFTPDEDQGGDAPEMTATEYVGRNKRTLATRDKKVLYWRDALGRLLTSLLIIDREEFGTPIEPMPVKVVFPDAVQESPKTLAETAGAQKNADASSRYTRVKTMHPDWDEADIEAELKRIEDETPAALDPTTLGLPPAPGTADPSDEEEDPDAEADA
ncbi:portal protein [Microbacterium phage DelaGarza]|nr:portal protein [Microbacterium phage DelaGarza]